MLALDFVSNVDDIIGLLDDLEARHIPFALSLALNETAKDARAETVRRLPDRFALRNSWVQRGIRVEFSRKDSLVARVGTADWFMEQQEEGGTRGAFSSHGFRFVPTLEVRHAGSFRGPIRRGMKPATLIRESERARVRTAFGARKRGKGRRKKPLAFLVKFRSGQRALVVRSGDRRKPLDILYTLETSVAVKPRWGFGATVQDVSVDRLRLNFLTALQKALATDRRRPRKSAAIEHLIRAGGPAVGGFGFGGSTASGLVRGG